MRGFIGWPGSGLPAPSRARLAWLARLAAAATTAWLLASSFPPYSRTESVWAALVPLLLLARFTPPRAAFAWGWLAGAGFWLVTLRWLLALGRTGAPWALAALGWVALSAYCALYTACFAFAVAWLWRVLRTRRPLLWRLVLAAAVPVLWVGFEYLRCTLFTGFAWNQLGVSLYRSLLVIQVASLGGVYAVSAVVASVNMALAALALRFRDVCARQAERRLSLEVAAGLLLWAAALGHGFRAVRQVDAGAAAAGEGTRLVVACLQPNIPQHKKWPERYGEFICARIAEMTRLAGLQKPDLIVWPETAIPEALGDASPEAEAFVAALAREAGPVLAGAMEMRRGAGRDLLYNSAFLFDARGERRQVYRKRHLVPFGEYIPLESVVPLLGRLAPLGFSCTPGATSTVFRLDEPAGAAFSSLICFEDTVAPLARRSVLNGARLLVNQTNDAWFDGTAAAVQHMSHGVFRCIENRVPAVRCANTGVTCFIDPLGRVARLEQGADALYAQKSDQVVLPPRAMALTPYTRYGDLLLALPCAGLTGLVFVLAALAVKRESRRATMQTPAGAGAGEGTRV